MFFHPLTYPLLSDHPLPCVSSCQCDCLPCPNWFHLCLITYLVSCVYIALPSVVKVCLCTSTSSIPAIFLLVFMSSFFFFWTPFRVLCLLPGPLGTVCLLTFCVPDFWQVKLLMSFYLKPRVLSPIPCPRL